MQFQVYQFVTLNQCFNIINTNFMHMKVNVGENTTYKRHTTKQARLVISFIFAEKKFIALFAKRYFARLLIMRYQASKLKSLSS